MIERTVQLTGADRSGDGERFAYSGTGLYFHRVDGGPLWLRVGDDRMLIPVYAGRSILIPFRHFWLVHAAGLSGTVQVLILQGGELVADAPARGQVGTGRVRSLFGTDSEPGDQVLETVPAGVRWNIFSVYLFFYSDATVIDRGVNLLIRNPTPTAVLSVYSLTPVPASQTAVLAYFGSTGYVNASNAMQQNLALPSPCLLPEGWSLGTAVLNMQPGDDFGSPRLILEEWVL